MFSPPPRTYGLLTNGCGMTWAPVRNLGAGAPAQASESESAFKSKSPGDWFAHLGLRGPGL